MWRSSTSSVRHNSPILTLLPYHLSRPRSSFSFFPSCRQSKGKHLLLTGSLSLSLRFSCFLACESLLDTSSEVYSQSDLRIFEIVSLGVFLCSDSTRPPREARGAPGRQRPPGKLCLLSSWRVLKEAELPERTPLGRRPEPKLDLLSSLNMWLGSIRSHTLGNESHNSETQPPPWTFPDPFRTQLLVQGFSILGMACLFRNNREA